jgi:hypothetical protein
MLEADRNTTANNTIIIQVMIALLLGVILLSVFQNNRADPDIWGYLAFGRLFWETGSFPYQDVFSYVSTEDVWIYHEWLTGVLFYPIYLYYGDIGLQSVKILMALGTVALVINTARRRGAGFWGVVVIILLTKGFLSFGYSPVRAQIFTYFFFALTLDILESSKESTHWRKLLWLIPIQLLWCNFHGGFLAGLGLIALYGMGEALAHRPFWPYLLALLLCVSATLLNPYGIHYWAFIHHAVSMSRPEIAEWFSIVSAIKAGVYQWQVYYFMAMIIIAVCLMWLTERKDITVGLALVVSCYLGLKHLRHQVFFLLLVGAYLAEPLSHYLSDLRNRFVLTTKLHRLNSRFLILSYLMIFSLFTYRINSSGPLTLSIPSVPGTQEEIYYPVGAVEYIRSHLLVGKLLAEFNWGEYLLWTLHPQCQVAIDGRYETVYPEKIVRSYMDFSDAKPGWQNFLEEYPPDMILLSRDTKIFTLIQDDPRWRQVYADAGCGLFIKN